MAMVYLGDGLYAHFDGMRIRLMANSPTEPTDIVYLNREVWESLVEFVGKFTADEQSVHSDAGDSAA